MFEDNESQLKFSKGYRSFQLRKICVETEWRIVIFKLNAEDIIEWKPNISMDSRIYSHPNNGKKILFQEERKIML